MALNIGGTDNGKPYFKYSAKSDKWFVRGDDGQDKEIERPTFAADLANIRDRLAAISRRAAAGTGDGPELCSNPLRVRGTNFAAASCCKLSARSTLAVWPRSPAPRSTCQTSSRTSTISS